MQHAARSIALAGLLSLSLASVAAAQGDGAHTMLLPSELSWADVPSLPPGAKIAVIEGPMNEAVPFTARLMFPAGYQIPAHSHPAVERVTVLSGTLNLGTGDKLDKAKTQALPAGGFMLIPVDATHFVWTAEETVAQLNGVGPWGITYVDPADDPRK